ncbi:hypothetical protein K1W69_15170 [Hoeflea sp. WL0058]|uniref:Uncharacterized protein n=1 Tax=Flavimaribacter sediminis TaxID=2865987 RepID=A0AAE2ZPK8_9HYPH|nr:hypothetical protein [Flavimaribacter sediminis]MBW8638536.1 hypothetical protein [Flavimaribacter sediminis]
MKTIVYLTLLLLVPSIVWAKPFDFATIVSLDDMHAELKSRFPLGADRADVYRQLSTEGGAAHYAHPDRANVEKYLYDIDLCKLHVFRWNISAHFFDNGKLTQIFVNGEAVHAAGDEIYDPSVNYRRDAPTKVSYILQQRPEASEGENVVSYVQLEPEDGDGTVDVTVVGGGPTRADPWNLGSVHGYPPMPRWHSIFTLDKAGAVVPYSGACPD